MDEQEGWFMFPKEKRGHYCEARTLAMQGKPMKGFANCVTLCLPTYKQYCSRRSYHSRKNRITCLWGKGLCLKSDTSYPGISASALYSKDTRAELWLLFTLNQLIVKLFWVIFNESSGDLHNSLSCGAFAFVFFNQLLGLIFRSENLNLVSPT